MNPSGRAAAFPPSAMSKRWRTLPQSTPHIIAIASLLSTAVNAYHQAGIFCTSNTLTTTATDSRNKIHAASGCPPYVRYHPYGSYGGQADTELQAGTDGSGLEEGGDGWDKGVEEAMAKFKRSVIDSDGRLRQLSNDRVKELADAAAEDILIRAEKEGLELLYSSKGLLQENLRETGEDESEDDELIHGYTELDSIGEENAVESFSGGLLGEKNKSLSRAHADEVVRLNGGVDKQGTGIHDPRDVQALEEQAEFQSILAALQAYHSQHGNLILTHAYVMPKEGGGGGGGGGDDGEDTERHRGWQLGKKVYNMKFWQKYVRDEPSRRAELAKLGFVWGRLQDEYNLFLEALLVYQDLEGSLLVPTWFVVPEKEPWPWSCRGMRLGARVAAVRNQSLYVKTDVARWYQLDNMGFVWDLTDAPFRQVFAALMTYKSVNGTLRIPVAFRVPSCDPWPKETWGLALGQKVYDIRVHHRYIKVHPDRIRALNKAGFIWADAGEASYSNIVLAVKAYRKIKGREFSAPSSFVVPSYLPWPQSCWGLKLGTALVDIRCKGRHLKGEDGEQRRLELEHLGVFAQSRETVLANMVQGVRCYRDLVGDTMVPQGFVVPNGEPWPLECRGHKLGSMLYGLRRFPERLDRHPGVRAELTSLGFSWHVPKRGPKGPRRKKPLVLIEAPTNDVADPARANNLQGNHVAGHRAPSAPPETLAATSSESAEYSSSDAASITCVDGDDNGDDFAPLLQADEGFKPEGMAEDMTESMRARLEEMLRSRQKLQHQQLLRKSAAVALGTDEADTRVAQRQKQLCDNNGFELATTSEQAVDSYADARNIRELKSFGVVSTSEKETDQEEVEAIAHDFLGNMSVDGEEEAWRDEPTCREDGIALQRPWALTNRTRGISIYRKKEKSSSVAVYGECR